MDRATCSNLGLSLLPMCSVEWSGAHPICLLQYQTRLAVTAGTRTPITVTAITIIPPASFRAGSHLLLLLLVSLPLLLSSQI